MSDLGQEIHQAESILVQIPTVPAEIKQQILQYNSYFSQIDSQVKQSEETIRSKIKLNILEEAVRVMTTAHKECPHVSTALNAIYISVLVAFVLIAILFIIGLCSNCVRSFSCGIGFIAFILLIAMGTVSFITLIAGSDFCLTSKKVLVNYVETPMTHYYLYCHKGNASANLTTDEYSSNIPQVPHMASNVSATLVGDISLFTDVVPSIPNIPLQLPPLPAIPHMPPFPTDPEQIDQLFEQVEHYLNQSKGLVRQLEQSSAAIITTWCNLTQAPVQQLCKHVATIDRLLVGDLNRNESGQDSLLTRLDRVSVTVADILNTVECSAVTPQIDSTLSNVCSTLYESFFLLLLNSALATVCFYILLLISIWMIYRAKAEKDAEYLPSAPSSAHLSQYMREFSWSKPSGTQKKPRSNKTTVL